MAVTAQTLLDQTDDAISALLVALADVNVQEYQMPDGRRLRRAEFATTLDALNRVRSTLQRQVALTSRPRVTLGRLSRN
jgi:hypothetical protein